MRPRCSAAWSTRLGLLQLLAFLEEDFDVAIDDAEVTADNFRTIADIERMVHQKAQVG